MGTVEASGTWQEVAIPLARVPHNTGVDGELEAAEPPVALPALSLGAAGFRIFHRTRNMGKPNIDTGGEIRALLH